jgi:hypothetical protein
MERTFVEILVNRDTETRELDRAVVPSFHEELDESSTKVQRRVVRDSAMRVRGPAIK